jgi:CO/xanthine dehydrogenase FAD-binding subunit
MFNPQYDDSEKTVVNAENLLMAVGQRVDLSFLDEKYQVQLNRRGLLDVEAESAMTSRKGIFGAGDATTGPGTVIGAIATGHKAANGMNAYLGTTEPVVAVSASKALKFDHEGLKVKKALTLKELELDKRTLTLEDSFSATLQEAAAEASRCMNCGCYAVNPSDVAPALIALGAKVVTNKRIIDAESLFDVRVPSNTVLDNDEIITEIQVPTLPAGAKSAFIKFAIRKSIDFPVVNCAVRIGGGSPRICLGAVAPMPYRAYAAEEAIAGKTIDEATAEAAGAAAVLEAQPFEANKYKIQLAKVMVKRALLAASK